MRTVFQDLLLVTWAVDPGALAALLPGPIVPHVDGGGRAYVSIVIANMRGMRPAPVPEALGSNAYQIVYRAVVETGDDRRRGVFFLRSDCNDPALSYVGNRMTEFRFHHFRTSSIGLYQRGRDLLASVETRDGRGDLVVHARDVGPAERLPPAEGFASVADEKRALVELFHAYAHDPARGVVYDMESSAATGGCDGWMFATASPPSSVRARSRLTRQGCCRPSTSASAPTSGGRLLRGLNIVIQRRNKSMSVGVARAP